MFGQNRNPQADAQKCAKVGKNPQKMWKFYGNFMAGQSKLYFETHHPKKDGSVPVRVCAGYGLGLYVKTGASVMPGEWNPLTGELTLPKQSQKYRLIMSKLRTVEARMTELSLSGRLSALTKKQVKALLENPEIEPDDMKDEPGPFVSLGEMFDRVIATKTGRNAKIYEETAKKMRVFTDISKVRFEEITKMWLEEFRASEVMRNLAPNSQAIHLRNLRHVVNAAIDEGITQNYPFRRFRMPGEETEKRSLPIGKMRALLNADLEGAYAEYRDIFMLMVYLIGINIADLAELTPANIRDGRLVYRRAKTHKPYSIKIEPEALAIINRHRGKKHLLAPFDRYADYNDYKQHLNNGLKKIGEWEDVPSSEMRRGMRPRRMVPICPEISTYWSRHSWATYAADLDVPRDVISESLGHEYGSKTTAVYVKFNLRKVDEANRRVIDYILGKEKPADPLGQTGDYS